MGLPESDRRLGGDEGLAASGPGAAGADGGGAGGRAAGGEG
ncbi:hypothetical protein BH23ACT2_BH23ACT2_03260 [soil metagenome]